jgi:two-component system, chemotaxis family, CheB/CheR fusion protein
VASDGQEGLEKIRRKCPDLVLCDLAMPQMDGYKIARRVRGIAECAHARLVSVTAFRDDTAYVRSASAGFDAHLQKPITLAKLTSIAERFGLDRRAGSPRRPRKG